MVKKFWQKWRSAKETKQQEDLSQAVTERASKEQEHHSAVVSPGSARRKLSPYEAYMAEQAQKQSGTKQPAHAERIKDQPPHGAAPGDVAMGAPGPGTAVSRAPEPRDLEPGTPVLSTPEPRTPVPGAAAASDVVPANTTSGDPAPRGFSPTTSAPRAPAVSDSIARGSAPRGGVPSDSIASDAVLSATGSSASWSSATGSSASGPSPFIAGAPAPSEARPVDRAPRDAVSSISELRDGAPNDPVASASFLAEAQKHGAKSPEAEAEKGNISWLARMRQGLARSTQQLSNNISAIFTKSHLTKEALEDFEDALLMADLGVNFSSKITKILSEKRYDQQVQAHEIREIIAQEIENTLAPVAKILPIDLTQKPHVILMVGVNGSGKTTTIGKLASRFSQDGLKVMLAAGDTFRAAAIEQLEVWAGRLQIPVVSKKLGSDAASLAYEAYQKAREQEQDILIIDTAGRLQNKTHLMEECAKIIRVLQKINPQAPHSVLQVLDATTGQNALRQVEIFAEFAQVNGLVMTKLDGTARGGILVAIAEKFKIPVYFIGVGEKIDDLQSFNARDFARSIAGVHMAP